ncbi:hypothetical protein B0H19DRAFT_1378289 [Mycena capillaripes]|nr:hypothetical protein B0H19DRAFT_1378289 [Mycena capillaripes]
MTPLLVVIAQAKNLRFWLFQVVRIDSLVAALDKLNIKIPVGDLMKAIHEEDEARRKLTPEGTQRRAALSMLALQPIQPSAALDFTPVSRFIANPPEPANVDPLRKERRRRLLELTKEAFPDGKVPDPFKLS